MSDYIEEFVAFLGWEVDASELEEFSNQVDDLGKMLKWVSTAVAAVTGVLTALTVTTNAATAANIALARSVGVSTEFLEAMGGVLRPLGFEVENVVDLVEEMNNKMGESIGLGQPITAVTEATKMLGLEFKNLKDLAPEEQFIQILDAAKNLDNQQAAVSAVDMLMGGEANKILGFLRTQDAGLLELIEKQLKLNMLTEKGREGAERFNNVFGEMMTVVNSAKQEFFGLIGEALSPLLEKYRDWLMANNELVKSRIAEWADTLGRAVSWVITQFNWFIGKIDDLVKAVGGLENMLRITGITIMSLFGAKTILAIGTFIKFMKAAGTEALLLNLKAALIPATIAAIIALFYLVGEDLYHFFTGGESALGKIGEKISDFLHDNVKPAIADFLGMTPEEFDLAVVGFVDTITTFFGETVPDIIIAFVDWFINVWSTTWENISETFGAHLDAIGAYLMGWFDFTIGVFSKLQDILGVLLAAIVTGFQGSTKDIKALADSILNFFLDIVDGFVRMISSLPEKLLGLIQTTVQGIKSTLADIPLVGDLVDTGRARGAVRLPVPSAPVRAAVGAVNKSQQSVSQRSSQTNNFNITQRVGESGEELGTRIVDEIQKAAANAISVNDSGIEV